MDQTTAKNKLEVAANETAERVGEVAEKAQVAAQYQVDRLERLIRRNPVAAVSTAAGVGLLLAMIARR